MKTHSRNLISNIMLFGAQVLAGLWLVSFLVKKLGVEYYGLIPIATSMVAYAGIISDSFNRAGSRYLAVALHRNNSEEVNTVFNTGFFSVMGIAAITLAVLFLMRGFLPALISIPPGGESSVNVFLGFMMLMLPISAAAYYFTSVVFALNRLDLRSYILFSKTAIVVGAVYITMNVFGSDLRFVGVSYLVGATGSLVLAFVVSQKLYPGIKVSLRNIDLSISKDMFHTGLWLTFNSIGALLFLNTELIIVSRFCGARAAGEYGIVFQLVVMLRTMALLLAGLLAPTFMMYYAKKEIDRLAALSARAVELMGIFMALPVGIVCGFGPIFLNLWVGQSTEKLYVLTWILVGHLCINLAVLPIFSLQLAYNKVKIPAIATLILGVVDVAFAILIAKYTRLGMYGVGLTGAIVLSIKNLFFTPWYAARIMKKSIGIYFKPVIKSLISALALALVAVLIGTYFKIASWGGLILSSILIASVYAAWVFFRIMEPREREVMLVFTKKREPEDVYVG